MNDDLSLGLNHAWEWFSLHADQRIKSLHIYVVFLALDTAAFGTFLQFNSRVMAGIAAYIGILVTGSFLVLEERNRALVKVGEAALERMEEILKNRLGMVEMELLKSADRAHGRGVRSLGTPGRFD